MIIVAKKINQSRPGAFLDGLPQEIDFTSKPTSLRATEFLVALGTFLDSVGIEICLTRNIGNESKLNPKVHSWRMNRTFNDDRKDSNPQL